MGTKPHADLQPTERSLIILLKSTFNLKVITGWLSGQSLTKKASLNAFSAGLDYGARLLVSLFVNPILLAGLGDFWYGVWQFLGRLIGYISPATGRPSQALKWTLAKQQASTDFHHKRLQVGNAIYVWLIFLPVLAFLGAVLAWFAPILLDAPTAYSTGTRLAAALLVANVIMVSLVDLPRSVLEGENLGYKRMGLSALLVFIGGGLMVIAVYLDTGIGGVAASRLTTTLLMGLLFFQVVRSYVPWFGIARPTLNSVRQFMGLSGWFLGWNLVMKLMIASDVLVMGVFDSAEMVTFYTLNKYVPETIVNGIAILIFGIMPGLGRVLGSGDIKKTARIRSEVMTITWLLITVFGATILMWNPSFVQLWVGNEYSAGSIPTLLIMLMIIQLVIIRNDAYLIDLTLNLRNKVIVGLISVMISLVISSILVDYFGLGIVGLCLGFIIGRSILSIGYPRLVGRFLNIPVSTQLKSVLRPAFVTAIIFGFVLALQRVWMVNSWIGLILSSGLTVAIIAPFAIFAGLSTNSRNRLWDRFRHLLSSRA